jgi:hypothetical protein
MTITYHRLTLVERDVSRTADKHIVSRWICDCGNTVDVAHSRVKSGATKSCGCLAKDASAAAATKHGGRGSPEYSSWIAMRRRCNSPIDKDYPRYGGRGISICPQWDDFATFLSDMGPRPDGTTLDRIDGSRGYEPGNVRWAPATVQGRNRRGTFIWNIKGQTFGSITEAAKAFAVSSQTIHRWVNGFADKRRGTTTSARPDCSVEERYS